MCILIYVFTNIYTYTYTPNTTNHFSIIHSEIFSPLCTIRAANATYIQEMIQKEYVLDQTTNSDASGNAKERFRYLHGFIIDEENKCLDKSAKYGFVVVLGNHFRPNSFIVTFTTRTMDGYIVFLQSKWATSNAYVVTSFPRHDCRAGALDYLTCFPHHDDWVVPADSTQMVKAVAVMYTRTYTPPIMQVYLF